MRHTLNRHRANTSNHVHIATPTLQSPKIRGFAALPLLLCLCHAASAQVVREYAVTVDSALSQLTVEARFGETVTRLSARSNESAEVLINANICGSDRKIRTRGRPFVLPSGGIRCLQYRVDLKRAAKNDRRNQSLSADNFIVSPAVWLWRPATDRSTTIRVRFHLPEGVLVSVPWSEADDGTFAIDRSPESADAPAVFGRFGYHKVDVANATLRVSLLKTGAAIDTESILNWLQATATDVTLAYGRFPNPSPQIVVLPSNERRRDSRTDSWSTSTRAIRFGRVIRDGGESVELFVNHGMPPEDFLKDWTATHEFSHLMLPYVSRKHKWISEGFAQYYQNVLLARSGAYEPAYAWQNLYAGLERGRKSRPELSPNEAASGSLRDGLMKVYWSGAALALLADVTLRERSDGEESLDSVLDGLQSCCLPAEDVWTGPELMSKLDSLLSSPVFMPLYRRHADAAGFPDTAEILARLGVQISDGKVALTGDAELAAIRSAITELDPQTARWRQGLATN